jgi:hypothetical protein
LRGGGRLIEGDSAVVGKGAGGQVAQRICGAEQRRECGPRAQRASFI